MTAESTYLDRLIALATDRANKFDLNEAVSLMRHAVEKFPGQGQVYQKLAEFLIWQKDYQEAETVLQRGLQIQPNFGPFWLTKTQLILELNLKQDVAKLCNAVANVEFDQRICFEVYRLLNSAAWHHENLSFLGAVDHFQKGGEWLPFARCEALASVGQADQALHEFSKANSSYNEAWFRLLTSRMYLLRQNFPNAGAELSAALRLPNLSCHTIAQALPVLDAVGAGEAGTRMLLQSTIGEQEHVCKNILTRRTPLRPNHDPKQVVFVTDRIRGRQLKMASALRKLGWRTIFLFAQGNESEVSPFADQTINFDSPEAALWIARQFNPRCYHLSTGFGDAASFLLTKERVGKIVFDPYDVLEGLMHVSEYADFSFYQRYCISNCTGLCARDLRVRHLFRNLGVAKPERLIFFPDFCWDEDVLPLTVNKLDGLHLAVCGFISIASSNLEEDWGYLKLAQIIAAQQVYLHFYPHPMQYLDTGFSPDLAALQELSRQNPFIQLHKPLAPKDLPKELSKFHVGLNFSLPHLNQIDNSTYAKEWYRTCQSSRSMDYLEAGMLTMIGPELKLGGWLLRRKGAAVTASLDILKNLKSSLGVKLNEAGMFKRITAARQSLSISRQIGRLIKFYEQL